MNKLQETEYFVSLLDLYGDLLSISQKTILQEYYEFNLSLQEISENKHISKSAASDALNKGKAKLEELEKVLKLYKTKTTLVDLLDEYKKNKNEKALLELERIIKDGI